MLWPTELKRRGGQATYIAPLQPTTFATFPSWRIRRELSVQDLPVLLESGCKGRKKIGTVQIKRDKIAKKHDFFANIMLSRIFFVYLHSIFINV